MKGDKFFEVVVDHRTGKVTKTEPITDGDDLVAAKRQAGAMAKTKRTLRDVVARIEKANAGYKAVGIAAELRVAPRRQTLRFARAPTLSRSRTSSDLVAHDAPEPRRVRYHSKGSSMTVKRAALLVLLFSATAIAKPEVAKVSKLSLPGGEGGIGFDDLMFSSALHRVLAPGGRTGKLDLIDPKTQKIEAIGGFSTDTDKFGGGHGEGTTSADAGGGFIFASDRSRTEVEIVDPKTSKIIGHAKLAGGPDYVRWVQPRGEVWITEPSKKQIEIFTLDKGALVHKGAIDVPGGPESLVIDAARGRAYTHTWADASVVIDLATHKEVARWKNGCSGSRGIALDDKRGFLFVGCEEGKAIALDVTHDGKQLGSAVTGKGVDIIAYSPGLAHLYVPGGDSATLTILGVGPAGKLEVLGSVAAATDSHCVAADDLGHAYVCDPKHGALLVITDPYPSSH